MISKLSIVLVITTATLSSLAQVKSDLIVTGLTVELDAGGQFISRVSVKVSNACRGAGSAPSFVLVTFRESDKPGSKAIYFVGSKVKPLRGGESQTLIFDTAASGKYIERTRHVLAEVDPYKKIAEADENNNWRTLFPDAGGQSKCAGQK